MHVIDRWSRVLLVFLCSQILAISAHALTGEQAQAIAIGDADSRIAALQAAVQTPDEATLIFLQALADGTVKIVAGQAVVLRDGKPVSPSDGSRCRLPPTRCKRLKTQW